MSAGHTLSWNTPGQEIGDQHALAGHVEGAGTACAATLATLYPSSITTTGQAKAGQGQSLGAAPLCFEDVDPKVTITLLARAFHVVSAMVWEEEPCSVWRVPP